MLKNISKVTKKLVVLTAAAVITVGSAAMCNIVYANNWEDHDWGFYYTGNGTEQTTDVRVKEDKSATYVYNNSTSESDIDVTVCGNSSNKGNDPYHCDYSNYNTVTVKKGNRKYINTSTYYPKYKYVFLAIGPCGGNELYLSGKWSPDNRSGY